MNVETVQINVTRWRCNKCGSDWERVKDAVACSEGHVAECRDLGLMLRYGTLDPAVAIWQAYWALIEKAQKRADELRARRRWLRAARSRRRR